jgi:hypothetical protein
VYIARCSGSKRLRAAVDVVYALCACRFFCGSTGAVWHLRSFSLFGRSPAHGTGSGPAGGTLHRSFEKVQQVLNEDPEGTRLLELRREKSWHQARVDACAVSVLGCYRAALYSFPLFSFVRAGTGMVTRTPGEAPVGARLSPLQAVSA